MLLFGSSSTHPTAERTADGGFCNPAPSPGQRLSIKTRWTLTSPPFCMWCPHASGENTLRRQEATFFSLKAKWEIRTSKQWHHTPGEWIQLFSCSYSFQSLLRNSSDKLLLPAKEIHLKEHQVTAALNKMTHLPTFRNNSPWTHSALSQHVLMSEKQKNKTTQIFHLP